MPIDTRREPPTPVDAVLTFFATAPIFVRDCGARRASLLALAMRGSLRSLLALATAPISSRSPC
jgi:hypothetical protein